jgi:hypothetical protein
LATSALRFLGEQRKAHQPARQDFELFHESCPFNLADVSARSMDVRLQNQEPQIGQIADEKALYPEKTPRYSTFQYKVVCRWSF